MPKIVHRCLVMFLLLATGPLRAVDSRVAIPIPQLSGVSLSPNSILGGGMVTGTVTLVAAASSPGVPVNIHSSAPSFAAVPASVVVQPGATSATFIIQTTPVSVNPNVVGAPMPSADISARIGNNVAKVAKLTVLPPVLASVALNPASVPGGTSCIGTVTISGAAAAGGIPIALSHKSTTAGTTTAATRPSLQILARMNAGPVTLPAQVTIPAGSTTAMFTVTTKPVATATTYEIDAAQGVFISKSATLTLQPPALANVTISPTDPIGGTAVTATITLTAPAPQQGLTYAASLYASFFCGQPPTAPSSVQISGGATSGTLAITTYPGFGNPKLTISGNGQYKIVPMGVREPIIDQNSLQFASSVKGGTTVQAKLHLNGAAVPLNCVQGYPMHSSNTQLANVPNKVVVTPGQTDAGFTITTSAVPSTQTVTISVDGNVGYGYASVQKTLTLTP
jgi:trimeric autotransporter adhesin